MSFPSPPIFPFVVKKKTPTPLRLPEVHIASAAHRLPSWAAIDGLQCPSHLALQQCSSEATATYKADIVRRLFPMGGATMTDLTGGLGVDFSTIAPLFDNATYVERRSELCAAMRHNAPLLGLLDHDKQVNIIEGDGVDHLKQMVATDLIFIDPARRDATGRKTVYVEDCEPNVAELLPLFLEKSRYTMVKLSPMLDVHRALQTLSHVAEVHIVGAQGECKELLLLIDKESTQTRFVCSDGTHRFDYHPDEEATAVAPLTNTPLAYLYEPCAALMKAGAFKLIAQRYGLQKFHANTHLYTSPELVDDFPGRTFRVLRFGGFGKRALRDFKGDLTQANLTVRNFPGTVAELRRRLKLKEGGNEYWFATTMADESHLLIACEKQ